MKKLSNVIITALTIVVVGCAIVVYSALYSFCILLTALERIYMHLKKSVSVFQYVN